MTTVKLELATIEAGTELKTFSTPKGADALIATVRESVMSMDGGSMKNGVSRKKIRSNAFAATKFKTKLKADHIDPLIASLELEIKPIQDTITAIKKGEKYINEGLDQIRKDVNQEVDAFESELKRVADEKAEDERLAEIAIQIELRWDYAHMMLNQFKLGELMTVDYLDEKQRLRDEAIAKAAAEKATIEAEAKAKAEIEAAKAAEAKAKQDVIDTENKRVEDLRLAAEETERQRQAAIQAEIELEEAEELRIAQVAESKRLADIAETQRVEREKQLKIEADERAKKDESDRLEREAHAKKVKIENDKQAKIRADLAAEQARLDQTEAVEKARLDEVARVEAENKQISDDANTRQANRDHAGAIRKAQKEFLMSKGVSEDIAKDIVMGIARGEMPNIKVIY